MKNQTHDFKIGHLSTRRPKYLAGLYNYFDESIFSRNSNGVVLAVRPEHIELFEARKLGTIPATVQDWEICGPLCRVLLSIVDRKSEITFYADLQTQDQLAGNLRTDMVLYMRFAWDKVIELKQPVNYGQRRIAIAA